MNVLVTGGSGQLGSEIKDMALQYSSFKLLFPDSAEVDICNCLQLETYLKDHKIKAVINCAAYTAVDRAEQEAELAEKVNATGVLNLVNALEKVAGKLIHISTDYVFDGQGSVPYKEAEEVHPMGVYGRTKRKGELAVLNSSIDGIVIRTSWLYSAYGTNFVKTMLRLGLEREEVTVVSDQVGSPTSATDLAKTCLELLSFEKQPRLNSKGKLYHFSNEGMASWYEFALAIMTLAKIACHVKPVETKDYPTLAKRPQFSVLNTSKIKNDFEIKIPHWSASLASCISKLKQIQNEL